MTASRGMAASPVLWSTRQRRILGLLLAIGAAGLIVSYIGTSGTLRLPDQVVWVNLAGAALLVSGAGIVGFLTAGRRTIGRRRLHLFGDVPKANQDTKEPRSAAVAGELVSAATMTRYHRADCPFVAGKPDLLVATAMEHQRKGRQPCGVCLSGGDAV